MPRRKRISRVISMLVALRSRDPTGPDKYWSTSDLSSVPPLSRSYGAGSQQSRPGRRMKAATILTVTNRSLV